MTILSVESFRVIPRKQLVCTMKRMTSWTRAKRLLAVMGLTLAGAASTGCQIDVGGQTLPSPYYIYDDIQYFAPGPAFKLANEAAAMKAAQAEDALNE